MAFIGAQGRGLGFVVGKKSLHRIRSGFSGWHFPDPFSRRTGISGYFVDGRLERCVMLIKQLSVTFMGGNSMTA